MVEPLLSVEALAEIRSIGLGQMVTEVEIFRQSVISPASFTDPVDYEFGDDEVEPEEVGDYSTATGETRAWFYTPTLQTQNTQGDDQLSTIDLHEVRMPFGTDVRVGDVLRRKDNGDQFIVVDTNGADTWAEKLRATVRRRE